MVVINFFGAPASGKSTMAAQLFYRMKSTSTFNCELVTEVAKDLVYDKNDAALSTQLYVAGCQAYRLARLEKAGIKIAITDAPLMLQPVFYKMNNCPNYEEFCDLIYGINNQYTNLNYKLPFREEGYSSLGRIHNRGQAYNVDIAINGILSKYKIDYKVIKDYDVDKVFEDIGRNLSEVL